MSIGSRGDGDGDLLEREVELDAIRRHVDDTAISPGALLLEVEPGLGKTPLWRAGVAYARERGFAVLRSSPSGSETQLSFSALVDLLGAEVRSVLASLPSPQRQALGVSLLLDESAETTPDELTIAAA